MDVSVIIPARNEEFLAQTVATIVEAIRGDTEVIAIIDGEHKGPEIAEHPRVRVVRNDKPLGQRQCVNLGARMSQAKYLLKTDGHSMLDQGFDSKLMAHCEYDWTVIPRMYNLHAYDLVCACGLRLNNHRGGVECPQCGKNDWKREVIWRRKLSKKTDWMYIRAPECEDMPLRVQYYGNRDFVCTKCGRHHEQRGDHEKCRKCGHGEFEKAMAFPVEYKAHRQWAKRQGDIADVMNGQGACWFLHRERYWDLEGLDEGHGGWGQMGVEIAAKAWLSGGRHVVNRKTWFAHFFRCGNGPHFPYRISGQSQVRARKYSIDLWTSGRWAKQVRPLEWMAEKFWPVPTWDRDKVNRQLRDYHPVKVDLQPIEPVTTPVPSETPPPGPQPSVGSKSEIITKPSGKRVKRLRVPRPILSVIVPARNEKFLDETLEDLLRNLATSYEIIIGLDGMPQDPEFVRCNKSYAWDDRVKIYTSDERIGMRPMINRLANMAVGKFLMKLDGHCAIDKGMDKKLLAAWENCGCVVPHRYDLDTQRWKRRKPSRTDCRRLTHSSEDDIGLRALDWPEYTEKFKDQDIIETMACSGSCWLMKRGLFLQWGGWDETHGTFGQEGCELACKIWLSGGRLLLVKTTWYAHWNRGKACYALGPHQKTKSINYSHDLWLNNKWYYQKYAFDWLIEKFAPPGWPPYEAPESLQPPRMGGPSKAWRPHHTIDDLWEHRIAHSEPSKRHRLTIFWLSFEPFVRSVLAGSPDYSGRYHEYLLSHTKRTGLRRRTEKEHRHVDRKMQDSVRLILDIKTNGIKAPLAFYRDEAHERMIQWKGYRRLVIAHVLGIKKVPLVCYYDKRTAATMDPDVNVRKLRPLPANAIQKICTEQFAQHGERATDKHWVHRYSRLYDRHFHEMETRTKALLELGIARGASLAIWREYFRRARIVGVDNDSKGRWKRFADGLANTEIMIGDETDEDFMGSVAQNGPYDIIIDDASHEPKHQAAAFEALWPSLSQYGFYVIEDIYRSFSNNGKGRCIEPDLEQRIYNDHCDIMEIHHYKNICFIRKAPTC
jgi:glycosyltransferase involved in cell wall biosynthesis/GT2 family glycosyltransferase